MIFIELFFLSQGRQPLLIKRWII